MIVNGCICEGSLFCVGFYCAHGYKVTPFSFKDTRVKYLTGLRNTLYNTKIVKNGGFDCEVVRVLV